MFDAIPLLPPPESGWHYTVHLVHTGAGPMVAVIQEQIPEPPVWWEDVLSGEGHYTEGALGLLGALWVLL